MNNDFFESQTKNIQTLSSIAIIASPVSLVFGGLLLSLAALVCAFVGRSKLNALFRTNDGNAGVLQTLDRQNKVGLVVSCVAVAINLFFFSLMSSALIQAVQSGDYSQFYQLFGLDPNAVSGADGSGASQKASVWD